LGTKAVRFVALPLASLSLLVAGTVAPVADEFRTPAIAAVHVEWRAALDQLRSEINTQAAVAPAFSFARRYRLPASDPRSAPALVQLNAITSRIFGGIGRSPVPVLLPFDTAAYLEAQRTARRRTCRRRTIRPTSVLSTFSTPAPPATTRCSRSSPAPATACRSEPLRNRSKSRSPARSWSNDVSDPLGGKGEPVKALAAQYPDLRRFIREGYVRYAFTRFGVPYVVSIQCLDSAPRPRRLACREAYPVAERFLKALHVAGGLPSRPRTDIPPEMVERPAEPSSDFTYRPSGDIIANSGYRRQGGHPDLTAYSQIRFPLQKAPAFAHSQSFRNRKSADRPVDELAGGNTSYPWQDNFCEARSFGVGQCAGGFGHQGQDIRPAPCPPDAATTSCDPKQQGVVAVRDAVVLRAPKQQRQRCRSTAAPNTSASATCT